MQIHKLISVMIFSADVLATHRAGAQLPLPPPPAMAQPPSSATRDIETDLAQMTKRNDLTDEQAAKVRGILTEQTKKSQEALKDESLSFEGRVDRLKSLKEVEISRVSDVLTRNTERSIKRMFGPPRRRKIRPRKQHRNRRSREVLAGVVGKSERSFRNLLFLREWEHLKSEFESSPEFVKLVTSVHQHGQKSAVRARAPKLIREAHDTLKGEVVVAHDLCRF